MGITKTVINGRHLEGLANIDVPCRIAVKLIIRLELRCEYLLILYRIINSFTTQTKRKIEPRRELFAVGGIERISSTYGAAFLSRSINRFSLIGIPHDK